MSPLHRVNTGVVDPSKPPPFHPLADEAVSQPFKYSHLGSLAYVGNAAVFDFGKYSSCGWFGSDACLEEYDRLDCQVRIFEPDGF